MQLNSATREAWYQRT